ncbi:MAG: peptidylprolyl isomerase [Flavobacteriales bacterium]
MLFSPQNEEEAIVAFHTKFGTMKAKLYNATPKHRDNFLKLVEKGFFDSTSFHRVIEGFMIQGGDPLTKKEDPDKKIGQGGPGYTIEAEIRDSLFHRKGALAAARKGDKQNPERRSSGSQFYIVDGRRYGESSLDKLEKRKKKRLGNDFAFSQEQVEAYKKEGGTPKLDGAYTVFGQVFEGKSVIDSIAAVPVQSSNDRPVTPVRMEVEILQRP